MSESLRRSLAEELSARELAVAGEAASGQPAASIQVFPPGPDDISRYVQLYVSNPLFENSEQWTIEDNPYRRPVDKQTARAIDFGKPLKQEDYLSANSLVAHRMLLNIYETDLLFLPDENFAAKKEDFLRFYSNENKLMGEMIRPGLEKYVFGFLEDEISITGKWTADALKSYLDSLLEAHERSQLEIATAILSSREPEKNALALLVQVASDFLSEASGTTRNVLGKYGNIQSELFKIVIDDYGYGIHQAKHSTLFENTMASCGLSTQAHTYWQFYLGSSLALGNYYHYVSRDHRKFFECLGAVAYAEAMFAHTCKQIAEMLRAALGSGVDTYYFDEHGHIDAHHGRMAFDNLVAPAIEKYGDGVAEQIVRGLEEIKLLTAIADEDFIAQINWSDSLESFKAMAQPIYQKILSREIECAEATRAERQSDIPIMRALDQDKLLVVESGALNFRTAHDRFIRLDAKEGIVIPRQRMHGIKADSEECVYHIYDIGDHKTCLS